MSISNWNQLFSKLKPLIEGFNESKKDTIISLLKAYNAKESDFQDYVSFSENGYSKNLVKNYLNSNIIVMCWAAGQASLFHGHEGSKCFVKVLRGQLKEQQVSYPNGSHPNGSQISRAQVCQLKINDVRYIDDSIGLHRVSNISPDESAVTLHIYIPAYEQVRLFESSPQEDTLTMERSHATKVTFDNIYNL